MATKAVRRARRERLRQADIAMVDATLAITCPVCGAAPSVWCFVRPLLGPDMHERRYAVALVKES